MSVKLAVGIRDNQPIHISELSRGENGLKCNCTCPACGKTLEARLGSKNQWHFAHHEKNDCDILRAQETGLHRLAKKIIEENSRILVPGLTIERAEVIPEDADHNASSMVVIDLPNINAKPLDYDSVETEKTINDIRADAVIASNNGPVVIEVAVFHFVDEYKEKKLETLNCPAFEIDLKDLLEIPQTRETVENAVLKDETNRRWVCNPKRNRLLEEKKAEFRKKLDAKIQVIEQEERERQEREREKRKHKQENIVALQELLIPDNYARELKRLRNDEQATNRLKKSAFLRSVTEYPFYMDIPITGEIVFTCDRRIWQSRLFESYVYWGFGKERNYFDIENIANRIFHNRMTLQNEASDYPTIRFEKQRTVRTKVVLNGREEEISLSRDVIKRYFDYLCLLGFMYWSGWDGFSECRKTLEPQNGLAADVLKRILGTVNQEDPDINYIIQQELARSLPEPNRTQILSWR